MKEFILCWRLVACNLLESNPFKVVFQWIYANIKSIFKKNSRWANCHIALKTVSFYSLLKRFLLRPSKNIRELRWMSHGAMRFRLNFLFISAFFDILASLSIPHVCSSGFAVRWKSSCLDIPRTIIKFDYIN